MTASIAPAAAAVRAEQLDVVYRVRGRDRRVIRGLDLAIAPGESYGLVGESGCGKSTMALALVGALPANGRVSGGALTVAGRDVGAARGEELRRLRTDVVAMVYQSPGRALNPTMRVGDQIAEAFVVRGSRWEEGREGAHEMLRKVKIADPDLVMRRYPHELSGGMQQRVVIAMALAKRPELLILDEPTTGLDATVEAEVLDLIAELRAELRTSVLFISHNLNVIARMCDRVGVLYAGRLAEEGPVGDVFREPRHPYTASLVGCIPRAGMRKDDGRLVAIPGALPTLGSVERGCVFAARCPVSEERCATDEPALAPAGGRAYRCHYPERAGALARPAAAVAVAPADRIAAAAPLLEVEQVAKTFGHGGRAVRVLQDVSFALAAGETLGVVGESGSGKSTLARVLLGLEEPDDGARLRLDGRPLRAAVAAREDDQVRTLQIVFQNPDSALNQRHTIRRILRRALRRLSTLPARRREERIGELAEEVRLPVAQLDARPAGLSGGMKQRVAIARAFAGAPRVVVCDEPTSALDVSVQAAIVNLMVALQREHGTAFVFISHDLAIVQYIADRIMVMYLGRVMEIGAAADVFVPPHHPYTEALLSAPRDAFGEQAPTRVRLQGDPPSVADPPSGCVFQTRCPRKLGAICETEAPPCQQLPGGRQISCHIPAAELERLQRAAPSAPAHRSKET
ncbi:ABC transporter ATP-binding protein [Conexibacter sp. CPCC 206217]|uniref:ABC transporter ATP-binding protein n=1 Tax=Conexibacter sp. CPCC 206217 TaxID=3064574 RepID=UPI002716E1CA|nr:ABC transporter ATP-binding protein [Conexibacter sp. CPCC 206217]MDO8210240.1 ABC transporter ATP-binding protein [Conexibacter sp. CPCC 206217]